MAAAQSVIKMIYIIQTHQSHKRSKTGCGKNTFLTSGCTMQLHPAVGLWLTEEKAPIMGENERAMCLDNFLLAPKPASFLPLDRLKVRAKTCGGDAGERAQKCANIPGKDSGMFQRREEGLLALTAGRLRHGRHGRLAHDRHPPPPGAPGRTGAPFGNTLTASRSSSSGPARSRRPTPFGEKEKFERLCASKLPLPPLLPLAGECFSFRRAD